MNGRKEPSPYGQTVDHLFTCIGDGSNPPLVAAAASDPQPLFVPPAPEPPAESDSLSPVAPTLVPVPQLVHWQDEYQWIQEERKRLEAYTLTQFALIKQQREDLLGRKAGIEETLALREQEHNRQMRRIAEATDTLEQRNRELAERETTLADQQLKLQNAHENLNALLQANTHLQQENESLRLLSEQLRIQTAHLQEATRAARSEHAMLEQLNHNRKKTAAEEQAELSALRRELEQRFATLETSEESLRRRVAEIDQLEAQIRWELEQRERDLSLGHQELEQAQAELRQRMRASKTANGTGERSPRKIEGGRPRRRTS